MRLFSEEVKATSSNSPLNILQVKDFSEIFFGVLEVEINEKKYPVEKISEYEGNPVVSIPVEFGDTKANYPFVLVKGKPEVIFNKQSDYVEIFESKIENPVIEEQEIIINEEDESEVENLVLIEKKNEILKEIKKAKKNALIAAEKEIKRKRQIQSKRLKEETEHKEESLKEYLETARENLVDEFINISNKIKNEVFENNDEKYSEIEKTIDNKIQDLAYSLEESLKKDFQNSSKIIDKSIKKLVKDLYENNINPRVDKELKEIAEEVVEKVSEIDKNLNIKLNKKADISLVESVGKELDSIRDANIELNNSINKGVQKALSRVGNVDKKILEISEKFNNKISETERQVVEYFDSKLLLVKEETLDITDEARKYFHDFISESKNELLSEIRKIKNEKPIEYIIESKKGEPIVKDWDSLEKDWNKKIHDKFENYKTDLRRYIAVYASGGGTNALQLADGGIINGDLIVNGSINAGDSHFTSLSTNSVKFNTTAGIAVGEGEIAWNNADGTLDIGLKGGNVTLQVGQEEVLRVVNKTNDNLLESEYKVVRVRDVLEGGAQGGRLAVVLAKADSDFNSATTIGVVTENITKNNEGFITLQGHVRGINTTGSLQGETWTDGDMLYLSPYVAGKLTNVRPTSPNHMVIIGFVEYAHQNNGKILVKIDNGYELDELHNVNISNVKNNDVLSYNSSLSSWRNTNTLTVSALSATSIYTTQLDALSANITVIDIKQYELSGFNVTGNSTIQGNISASGTISAGNMILSGNQVATVVNPVRTTLSGNGTLSTFAISGASGIVNPSALIVAIDGALQEPIVDYTVANSQITFTSPLPSGSKAVVISPTNTLQVSQMIPADGSVSSSKLDTNIQIAGQITAPNQAATNGTSLMTRDLGDARFLLNNMVGTYRWSSQVTAYTATNTGTGTFGGLSDVLELNTGATAGSVAFFRSNAFAVRPWHRCLGTGRSIVNWSLRTVHAVRIYITDITGSDTVVRILIGQPSANTTSQDFSASEKGIGLKIIDGVLNVHVANGTAVTTTSTGQTLTSLYEYDIVIDCDGTGNWNCYLNGTSVATGTGAPTGNSTTRHNALCGSITNGTTAASRIFFIVQQISMQIA